MRRQYAPAPFLSYGIEKVFSSSDRGPCDQERLATINQLGIKLEQIDSATLRSLSLRLRDQVRAGRPLEEVIEESFAIVREMSRRILGLYPYDVQILGGLALVRGTIAEMATGEGKTLVQLLPAYHFGLTGNGVHVATANSYLAERDQKFGQPVLEALGISSAMLPERAPTHLKIAAYAADVTYGTGSEFGFDYLRDQLSLMSRPKRQPGETVWRDMLDRQEHSFPLAQRGLRVAIIDEADSILIDEAVTPLLISGRSAGENPDSSLFEAARDFIAKLEPDVDYQFDPAARQVHLTEKGHERIYQSINNIDRTQLKRPWGKYVENALRAELTMVRDRQYLVRDKAVLIIDEFTGRVKEGSSWREGLHQAVESKERLPITCESESQASISRQKFYRLYDHVSGMTGTAMQSAGEFWKVYRLPVVSIPRHKPCQEDIWPPRIFPNLDEKLTAILSEIQRLQQTGRPVLVGTRSIETSENLAARLVEAKIPHRLLNANRDKDEAAIIAEAGQRGSVTIATNMAGRGTHIDLGEGVEELGGLHVIVSELDESKRVDDQLFGRAARQGKPGSGQAFLSPEDHLITKYEPEFKQLADSGSIKLENSHRHFVRIQLTAETLAYQSRLAVMEQDKWKDETKLRLS